MNNLLKTILGFKKQNQGAKIYIGICSTSFKGKSSLLPYLSYPKKIDVESYYFHCVFYKSSDAREFIKLTQNHTYGYFIDIESKNLNFKWQSIVEGFSKLKFAKIEPNQITVNSILDILNKNFENSILLLGTGNIASSLALRLKLINRHFSWCSIRNRNSVSKKIINKLYSDHKFSSMEGTFDIIINTIPAEIDFNLNNLVNRNSTLIEVTGKSLNYLNELNCNYFRLDISNYIITYIKLLIDLDKSVSNFGRKKTRDSYICSGGWIGKENDIVVDNFKDPKHIIGVCDGKGGFKKRLNLEFSHKILSTLS